MCKLCSLVYWRGLQGVVWCRVVACVRLSVACFVTDTFRCRKENKEKWHKWHRNRIESRWFRVISLLERYRKHRWTDVAFTELKWILFCLKLSHYFRPCAIFCRLSAFWEKIVSSFRTESCPLSLLPLRRPPRSYAPVITFSFISISVDVFHFRIFSASWWRRVCRDWILSADCALSFSTFSLSVSVTNIF